MNQHQQLRNVVEIAEALLREVRKDWDGVAGVLGPLGTGRLLALGDALAVLHNQRAA
jgi:hypothetical protein